MAAIVIVLIALGALALRPMADIAPATPADSAPDGPPNTSNPSNPSNRRPTVLGYLPYWEQGAAVADALREPAVVTTAAPWWYAPTANGDVVEQHPEHTDTGDDVVERLRAHGLAVMPTIANHRDGEWDFKVVPRLIADPGTRGVHVDNLVELVIARDFDGIVIDYELLGAGDRDNFSAFVTELGTALHDQDRRLAVALHAQASDQGSGGHNVAQDYRAIGRAADEVHLMTYDLHYDESDPGPVAPLPWITQVLDYATERIPADKLLLGVGLFGYDWGGGEPADDLQLRQVARRIADSDGERGWDDRAQAPWFRYRSEGVDRIMWFEDARSVEAKLALVERYDLAGFFLWRLGGVPDDIWQVAERVVGSPT